MSGDAGSYYHYKDVIIQPSDYINLLLCQSDLWCWLTQVVLYYGRKIVLTS